MAQKEEPVGVGDQCGPEGYENWHLATQGGVPRSAIEVPLYSDTHVTGEVLEGWGPYKVYNTIAVMHGPGCLPRLVLRINWHPGRGMSPVMAAKTDKSRFHGGGIDDEIASLVGLRLGIRLRPSSETRMIRFDPPTERPMAEDPALVPTLSRRNIERPTVLQPPNLVQIEQSILADYPRLRPRHAVAIVRAARLYQHALWTCDSDTNHAWLMLVSAVEVAAVEWRFGQAEDDAEILLRQLKPDWAERLERTGDQSLVRDMAAKWADLLGATGRFIKFVIEYLPEPPPKRPPVSQVDWTKKAMRAILQSVYDHRSSALHGGIPFPDPMCSLPFMRGKDWAAPTERPVGLASSSSGAVWMANDTPIHFHVFAYIVRESLLNWWQTLLPEPCAGLATA